MIAGLKGSGQAKRRNNTGVKENAPLRYAIPKRVLRRRIAAPSARVPHPSRASRAIFRANLSQIFAQPVDGLRETFDPKGVRFARVLRLYRFFSTLFNRRRVEGNLCGIASDNRRGADMTSLTCWKRNDAIVIAGLQWSTAQSILAAMAGCVLRAYGQHLEVDAFLAASTLAPCKVWHVGDRMGKTRPPSADCGFNLVTSDADDLPTQVIETLDFLRHHRAELGRLATMQGLDGLVLDFGIPGRDVAAQYDHFPAELVQLAANSTWAWSCPITGRSMPLSKPGFEREGQPRVLEYEHPAPKEEPGWYLLAFCATYVACAVIRLRFLSPALLTLLTGHGPDEGVFCFCIVSICVMGGLTLSTYQHWLRRLRLANRLAVAAAAGLLAFTPVYLLFLF